MKQLGLRKIIRKEIKSILNEGDEQSKQMLKLLNGKKNIIVSDIKKNAEINGATKQDIKQWIKDSSWEYLNTAGLHPIPPPSNSNWRGYRDYYTNVVNDWADKIVKIYFKDIKESLLKEGASTLAALIPGNESSVKSKFQQMQSRDRSQYGSDSYGSNWSSFDGIEFINSVVFPAGKKGEMEAEDYIFDNAEKWGPALAVEVGKNKWLIGGWVAE